jgi:hypothetical protein
MFTAMRGSYNFLDIALPSDIATLTGNSTLLPGDVLCYRFTKHRYGTVNAAGNGVDLATA